jgi:hypothetical protein
VLRRRHTYWEKVLTGTVPTVKAGRMPSGSYFVGGVTMVPALVCGGAECAPGAGCIAPGTGYSRIVHGMVEMEVAFNLSARV